MTDLPPQLLPLAQQLYRRLELRIGPLREDITRIRNECAARGLGNSGALVGRLLQAFQSEVEIRLDMIERTLRSYRLSCSPSLISESEGALGQFLDRLVAQHCQYIRYECEQVITPVLGALGDSADRIKAICEQRFVEVTRTACGLMSGIAQEIVMAARSDLEATKNTDRPSYVYHNTIQGPIGALAQGDSKIGQVVQYNSASKEVDEILRLVRLATADWTPDERRQVAAASAMLSAGAQVEEPDHGLLRAAVLKIGEVATGVAQGVATQALVAYLKVNGWLPPSP